MATNAEVLEGGSRVTLLSPSAVTHGGQPRRDDTPHRTMCDTHLWYYRDPSRFRSAFVLLL